MTLTRRLCFLPILVAVASCPAGGQTNGFHWNVSQAGTVGDGQADCTAVFQKLLDEAAAAGGGVVEVPAGRYRLDAGLSIPANVTLSGTYRVAPTLQQGPTGKLTGSVLLAYAGRGVTNGPPFIRLAGNNAVITGFIITYPEWKQADLPPVPYPPCVLCEHAENVKVSDCLLLNPYEGIKMVGAARHWIRDVTGYPIKRGIYVDECYDIGHIENVHFWPFGVAYSPDNPFCKWVNTEGVAFELARTDWHYVFNTFCFGYGVGYKFSNSAHGSANGNFLGLGADSCQRAVVVEQAQPPGLLISNGEFVGRWSSTDAVCLDIGPKVEGKVSLVNCSFWGPIDRCVWMQSLPGQFTASACHFVSWDNRGAGSPAIQLDAGKAIIQGCTFAQEGLDVQVGSNVVSAILTANQAAGGFRVDNQAGKHTQCALNEEDDIAWTREALSHYQIVVGREGDGRYLQGWHGKEGGSNTYRWSQAVSRLLLPVTPGEPYTLTLEGDIPNQAVNLEAGLYLEGKKIAPLQAGKVVTVSLPPCAGDLVRLELRSAGWVPQQVAAGSKDPRALGVLVSRITMRAASAGTKMFNANTGTWPDSHHEDQ
ncbi:MAG: glycosyl hydrolase family 28-related protein [Limisphaerales bacterium]